MSVIKKTFDYVEIKTKITSVLPFFMTAAYLYASGITLNLLRSLVFFFGMFFFDLTATTINNYFDSRKNHQTLPFSRRVSAVITLSLLALSAFFGLWLVLITDLVVLLLGGLCFLFGIAYSSGPVPISHGPYGEAVSGLFYGLLIPAILAYINLESRLLSWQVTGSSFTAPGAFILQLDIHNALGLLLLSVVPFCLTANIMLANNICDLQHDQAVGRYTLPHYIGSYALKLFILLYLLPYLSVIAMVILRYLSPLSLLLLVTIIPVSKNIRVFLKKPLKQETFIVSIRNFILILCVHTVLILLGCFLPGWGIQ
jgi:1,4-dihydroxy-2-naphthoate octaprenyltransferase